MSAADIHSILYRGEDPLKKKFVPKNDEKKVEVGRHWPGKAPAAQAKLEGEDGGEEAEDDESYEIRQQRMQMVLMLDKRLSRLASASKQVVKTERRSVREAIVIQSQKEMQREQQERLMEEAKQREREDEESDDGDMDDSNEKDIDEMRRRQRRQALRFRKVEESQVEKRQVEAVIDTEESDDDNGYTSSDSDGLDEGSKQILCKPVFVRKTERLTVIEKEDKQKQQEIEHQIQTRQIEEKKLHSKKQIFEALAREDEELNASILQKNLGESALIDVSHIPDDTDGVDAAQEYEDWKARELMRIKRDREEEQAQEKFLAAVERRRNMTAEERRADDRILDELQPQRAVEYKYQFMQKWYHRGAFFQDMAQTGEEALYLRDYNAPVAEDNQDKKILPKVMRLRRGQFGKAGQTKYTHLMDVDTTDQSAPWVADANKEYLKRRKGGEIDFQRPAKK